MGYSANRTLQGSELPHQLTKQSPNGAISRQSARQNVLNKVAAIYDSGEDISRRALELKRPKLFFNIESTFGSYDNMLPSLEERGINRISIYRQMDYEHRNILAGLARALKEKKTLFLGTILFAEPELVGRIRRHNSFNSFEDAVAEIGFDYRVFYPPFTESYIRSLSHLKTIKQRKAPKNIEAPEIEGLSEEAFYKDPVYSPGFVPTRIRKVEAGRVPLSPENAARMPLLTDLEEEALARELVWCDLRLLETADASVERLLQSQKKQAREQIIFCNLRLALSIAKKYYHHNSRYSPPIPDLFQEGVIGLMAAADRYDYRKGVKFGTYATYWIQKSILEYLKQNTSLIITPRHTSDDVEKLSKIRNSYIQEHDGEEPSIDYLASAMGKTGKHIEFLSKYPIAVSSLDGKPDDEKDPLEDLIGITEEESNEHMAKTVYGLESLVDEALQKLTPIREACIRYSCGIGNGFFPHTTDEIASEYRNATGKRMSGAAMRAHIKKGEERLRYLLKKDIQS